ncbi:MAG: iron-containing alcohol dehydrogenase [Proteobacteria bacterium]|nr:iron-containing alcohol dehydrogenase [Pseudomonadota bacterium]
MLNFTFHNPTRIHFGKNQIREITQEIPKGSRVLIIYGGGSVKKTGLLDKVKAVLKDYQVSEFSGIEPNPAYDTLMRCVDQIHMEKCDFLLAMGGGSVIDGTKFIAAAAFYEGEPWEILKTFGSNIKKALPFGVVLTLPATGSEMNNGAVITRHSEKAKLPFFSPHVYPLFSVLDPILSYTLPRKQIGNGVVDAFVHVMEQYLTYPVSGHVQDRFSEGLLLTLIEQGPKALSDPENYDVRADIMLCATLALNGLIGSGVPQDWATHMIGHEITVLYGLDHAQTLAIVLPAMLTIRKNAKREKLLQYADRVWDIKIKDEEKRMDMAIEKTREFFHTMELKTRLSDYEIPREGIEAIIVQLQEHGMVQLGEKQDVDPDMCRKVLELCY